MRIRLDHQGDWSTIYTDADPDRAFTAARYIVEAYEGEPLLCIRGRDILALPSLHFYRDQVHMHRDVIRGPVFEAVTADIHAFTAWQESNRPLLKFPDR